MTRTLIDTRKVRGRREVRLSSLDDLRAEVASLTRAEGEGRLRALGNWSLGQALQHLHRFMSRSIDGFERAPWFVPVVGLPIRLFMMKRVGRMPTPPGLRPGKAPFLPDAEADASAEAAALLDLIERVRAGTRFTARSPLLGRLDHDKWTALHLRHAELHLSFFIPSEAS